MSKGRFGVAGFVAVGMGLAPVMALASHGKAGLWEVTSTMNMPNMPQMSSAQMAQMQAMGMHMPMGHTITTQHCMTADQVAQDKPPPVRSRDCAMTNVKISGQTFSGDVVCKGEFQGQGHFSLAYESDAHYSGSTSMAGTANGHSMSSSSSFEGKWISADCGAVK